MATKKDDNNILSIEIKAVEQRAMQVQIEGESPLLMHKWSEKAKKEILDKQMGKKTAKKELKNPVRDYAESMYYVGNVPKTSKMFPKTSITKPHRRQ